MTKTSSELLSTFINPEAKPKQHCVKNTVYLGKIWQDGASYCGLLVVKLVVKRGWLTTKDFKYTYQTLRILVDRTAGIYQKKKVVRTTFFYKVFTILYQSIILLDFSLNFLMKILVKIS